MICFLSPYVFVLCYQLNAAYGAGLYVRDRTTCIEVIDRQEHIRPRFMIEMDKNEFYACGHAFRVIGTYR